MRELLGLPRQSPMCFDALVRMTRGMRVDDRDAARSAAEDASHTTLRRKLDDLLRRV